MKCIADKVFPFNESNELSLSLTLFNRTVGEELSAKLGCSIKLNNAGEITLYTSDALSKLSINLSKEYKRGDFTIKNVKIENINVPVKIVKIQQSIQFRKFEIKEGVHFCSMSLKSFSYTSPVKVPYSLYRLSHTSKFIEGYLSQFVTKGSKVIGIAPMDFNFKLAGQTFKLFRDDKKIYLQSDSNNNVSLFLGLSSFFSCKPIEIDMAYNNETISVYTPHYKISSNNDNNNVLCYLFYNNVCLDNFIDFLGIFKNINITHLPGEIFLYIENYVRAEYLDRVATLILYTSILEKMANTQRNEDSWKSLNHFLRKHQINCYKLNDGLDRIHDNENKSIGDFVKLRNFFVHHLGNKESLAFLENSDLLFYLKITITILILKFLGLNGVKFDKCFSNLSVYEETVENVDVVSKIFEINSPK